MADSDRPTGDVSVDLWLHGCIGSPIVFERDEWPVQNQEAGARSLEDMAMRRLVIERQNIADGTFDSVPWVIGRKIWEACDKHNLISTALWKHFASSYIQELPWPGKYRGYTKKSYEAPYITRPGLLARLVSLLVIPPGRLLTSLSFRNVRTAVGACCSGEKIRTHEWFILSKLENLVILQVHQCHEFPEQVVRTWGDRAADENGFKQLRVLELLFLHDITLECLRSLSKIKSLGHVQLSGVHITPDSLDLVTKYGWKPLCEHTSNDGLTSGVEDNDPDWNNWRNRLCPRLSTCDAAKNLFNNFKSSIDLPLLKARCSGTSTNWSRDSIFMRFSITLVPARATSAKRSHNELEMSESSRPVKKAVRGGSAEKEVRDMSKQFAGS